jgi:hypothetical protein
VNPRTTSLVLAACFALCILIPAYEPATSQSCHDVQVLATNACFRLQWYEECFLVKFVGTSEQQWVRTWAGQPFPDNYVGPASILVRRGMLTGLSTNSLQKNCVSAHQSGG